MIGIIVEILLSWLLLRFIAKADLRVLGWQPVGKRTFQLFAGLLMMGVLCALLKLWDSWLTHISWKVNNAMSLAAVVAGIWWNLKSVLFEELIFRGALLYILIQKIGWKNAVLISATAFGVYHWFSFNLWNNPIQMALVFLITALTGWVWAYAYVRTGSMALATGMHLGWNYVSISVFSSGTLGNQLLLPVKGDNYTPLTGLPSLCNFLLTNILIVVISFFFVHLVSDKRKKYKAG
ncbi:MAG: CPBP family intramembrane metalloprotease [Chitinophagaceae bacterium]